MKRLVISILLIASVIGFVYCLFAIWLPKVDEIRNQNIQQSQLTDTLIRRQKFQESMYRFSDEDGDCYKAFESTNHFAGDITTTVVRVPCLHIKN
jgi:hypothetical protein